jgi:hypothetical protein
MKNLILENNLGTAGAGTRRAPVAAGARVPWRLRPVVPIPCKATVAREANTLVCPSRSTLPRL